MNRHFPGVSWRGACKNQGITSNLLERVRVSLRKQDLRNPLVGIRHEDPGRHGIVRLIILLFIGDTEVIDMNRVQVQWNRDADYKITSRTMSATRVCPNWAIPNKFNIPPATPRILMTG
jgi:hypothetical protein